ncbi:hypothetical protein C8R43DRAFT_1087984 [Mycena crocata]|nr:hypothetical protein C8R43DRAFT_1087983 [Mycena crocata]KAJ7151421.1 hypothetical protein C8R43DRAFT_1087984 [Mycena crocata]
MTRTPGKQSPPKKTGRKKAPTAHIDTLETSRQTARSNFTQAPRTKNQYGRYVVQGKEFLRDVVEARRKKAKEEPGWVCPQGIDTDVLEKAFENPPNKHSSVALELFLTQKCFVENLGKSTADGIHGAFAKLWDTMQGDKYAGPYHFNEGTDTVTGCPARAQLIQSFLKVVKNKSGVKGAAATRNHAEAMSIADMKVWMGWSEVKWPRVNVDEKPEMAGSVHDMLKHFMMRAFGSSGFVLWTRNFELCALQMRDLTLDLSGPMPFSLPYFRVFLDNRKGWQNKQGFDADSRESNHYNIYEQSDTTEIDMYTHLLVWLKLYERYLGRELQPDDYVFPYIAPNGTIHPMREMTTQRCQDLIDEFCKGAGLKKSYTTHSFRRGGAQYRFMWAPLGKRWSLSIVRWWGGWASGEQVDTLMRYLMDSLQSYETGHGDALCPIPKEADKSFMGDHLLVKPVVTEEFRMISSKLLTAIADISLGNRAVGGNSTSITPTVFSSIAATSSSQTAPSQEAALVPYVSLAIKTTPTDLSFSSFLSSATNPAASVTSPPVPLSEQVKLIPGVFIPDLAKGDFAWREALRQWEEPNGRLPPLRDWSVDWFTGGMRKVTGSKRNQRKLIAQEYYRLGSNDEAFINAYPSASKRIGTLIKAIQASNKRLGLGQSRRSRRGVGSCSDTD